METISIPSPSVFLASPAIQSTTILPKTGQKRKAVPPRPQKQPMAKVKGLEGVTKPKQSKSRNGCVTCKTKRLKCDETKPTCLQCHKRNVDCGGYKKDFKWRSFEEATFTSKPPPQRARKPSVPVKRETPVPESPTSSSDQSTSTVTPFTTTSHSISTSYSSIKSQHGHNSSYSSYSSTGYSMNETAYIAPAAQYVMNQGVYTNNLVHTPPPTTLPTPFDNIQRAQSSTRTTGSSSSGQSPRLIDLLLPGTDLNAPPPDYMDFRPQQSDIPYQPGGYPQIKEEELELEDDVEEIIRQPDPTAEAWIMRLPSPAPSSRSSSSTDSLRSDAMQYLYKQPMLHHGSPEMLALGFDKQTCGILSVKDGPTENPWRTLVWPLARDSPALYHAISSMTAFHTSKIRPEMKVEGMEHMRQSVRHLAKGIANMRVDTALATTLVLAFSESWDVHVSSGIEHLRGAKVLVNQALTKHRQRLLDPEDLFRLKFLCNTWVYMDVIARLTTVEEDGNETDIDLWPSSDFFAPGMEIDPLMGCASTLFPLIGRVANLVRRVHKTKTNTINIISQAKDLKVLIENWRPPEFFEPPEDPDSEIQDSLQTAEAYRWATLLYLHQAVPEIPSLSSAALAKEVLVHLALVPASSRAIIVHIYPLLAAGCEATIAEDRTWVEDRWTTMSQRMLIGNIDRCLEVVKEVWARRDADALAKLQLQALRQPAVSRLESAYTSPVLSLKRAFSMAEESPTDAQLFAWTDASGGAGGGGAKRRATMQIGRNGPVPMPVRAASKDLSSAAGLEVEVDDAEFERTVRGRLHWVGVMKDWDWEVLLG